MKKYTLTDILFNYVGELDVDTLLDEVNAGDEIGTLRALREIGAAFTAKLDSIPLAAFLVEDIEGACSDCRRSAYGVVDEHCELVCSVKNEVVSPFQPACVDYNGPDDSSCIDPEIIDEDGPGDDGDAFGNGPEVMS